MKSLLLISILSLCLLGCSDSDKKPHTGNGNGSEGYTHNQLAEEFVKQLNLDEDFDVSLAKSSTQQWNYIVIYDPLLDSYDAIDIADYNPSLHNAANYYYENSSRAYYDLDFFPGHYIKEYTVFVDEYGNEELHEDDKWIGPEYLDRASGVTFEKVMATPKDLAKVAALVEVAKISKQAQFLSSNFGLSLDRGKEVARLVSHWKKASLKGMTNEESDQFSTELLGFSISQGKKAVLESMSGNSSSIKELVNKAADQNGITPEHATKLMTKVFGL